MTKYFETLQMLRVTSGLCLTDLSPTLGTLVVVLILLTFYHCWCQFYQYNTTYASAQHFGSIKEAGKIPAGKEFYQSVYHIILQAPKNQSETVTMIIIIIIIMIIVTVSFWF